MSLRNSLKSRFSWTNMWLKLNKRVLQAIAVAKDKNISQLEKENKALQKELLLAEMTAQRERIEVMEGAKHSAAVVMLKVKLQIAKDSANPSFDRSEWDLEGWTKRLAEHGDDEDLMRCWHLKLVAVELMILRMQRLEALVKVLMRRWTK
ncbi:hypothetical protein Hanom_Chr04g00335251 [Helianthus anomalus]